MASIRETRKSLMPVVIALVILDLACVGYLFSPAGRSRAARQREYTRLRQQLVAKQQEVLPTRGMDQKLKQASEDITGFYDTRFPAEYSAIAEELGKIAADAGVKLSGVKYDEKDAPIEGLHKLTMEASIAGDYLQEVKFINAVERDKTFFLIDGINLAEQQGNVRLQLKLETYLRNPTTAAS
jgi:type IV pilus assembly protein PilO